MPWFNALASKAHALQQGAMAITVLILPDP